jgi:thioesterase domain-containing protein
VQPHGPYFLGGYCLGGVLAYEMAQQLTALGEKVELVMMVDTYNLGTVSRRKLRWQAPLHFLQNLWFHSANLALARGQGRGKFLRDKLDTSIARLGIRLRAAYHGLRRRNNYPHLMVKKLNDQAALQYVPQPYSGRVAVIRAKGHFAGQRSPSMGWAEFVNSGLEVHQLPVYPKGILVEPFCRQLAETLKSCLRNA